MAKKENRMIRRRLVSSWISTVITISLVLLLVGAAALLLVNARSVSDYFKENMQVSIIMKQDVGEEEALAYQKKLDGLSCIRSTTFVSREQGIAEMADMLGEGFLDVFETAPVPISIDVTLKADYVSPDSLDVVKARIGTSPLVEEVVYQGTLVDALNANLRKISVVMGVMILLLLFISFVLIGNTVRLNVFSKRFTIHTMQLVGATRGFIRSPFVLRSAFQGLFAALLAIGMLVGGLFILRSEFSQLFEVFRLDLLLVVFGIVIVTGVLICTVSTFIVVNRLVGYSRDDLYAY
ncbi:MAG: permease-like cell division protein FtsX [Bacteroidales bacterium]|nr:permease-like cell division protein FtsX [Bacteroidales bacterium]